VKKPLLITAFIVVIAGAFLFYNYYFTQRTLDKWDLVPVETVLVYETSDCKQCLQELSNSPVAEVIQKASFRELHNDTLNSIQQFITSFQHATLVSLHLTKKDEFDFGYYVDNTPNFQQKFLLLKNQLLSVKGIKNGVRALNEIPINEISFKGQTFSWVEIENVWAGSFSPIIVEDIIRAHVSEEPKTFKTAINSVYQLPRIKNDGGNLYIHLTNLSSLFSLFTNSPASHLINNFGHSALLDAKVENKRIVLNGFSFHPTEKKDFFLSAFQDQSPVEFGLKNMISNRTIMLSDFGISNGEKFFPRLNQLMKNPHTDSLRLLELSIANKPTALFSSFKGELAVCLLESRKETITKVLLLKDEKNIDEWTNMFQSLAEKFAIDSVFTDVHSEYTIYQLPVKNLPEKLFFPIVSGFDNSYFCRVGGVLAFGENIDELKRYLDDIDQENTWGKSVAQNKYMESTLLESNVSVYINTPKIWYLLSSNLQPRWRVFIEENRGLLDQLGMGAIQFSHLNDTYYTNLSWSFREGKPTKENDVTNRYITNFDKGIARFSTVKSHVDNSTEVLIQDSAKVFSLVSAEGKILWQLPLNDFIAGEIHQIDFFNNGKLQYLFATPGNLHVVDRLGNYVKPFPVIIPEKSIDHVSIIDYDHTRKYRFLISSSEGKLWMFDKEGKNLEGWQPRTVDEGLISAVRHHRIHGRDYLMAIRKDGLVYLMNRRGELVRNFPLDLNAKLSGDYFLDVGRKASETYFMVISTDGVKFRFNLNGRLDSQDAMIKNTTDARFTLVSEENFKSFIVTRAEQKQFSVFDEKSNEIITSDFIGTNPVDVKYYSFGNGRDFIVISDLVQQLSFIYDEQGKPLTTIPYDSHILRVHPSDGSKLQIFYAQGKNITITSVP
jgi:hypothetical protein